MSKIDKILSLSNYFFKIAYKQSFGGILACPQRMKLFLINIVEQLFAMCDKGSNVKQEFWVKMPIDLYGIPEHYPIKKLINVSNRYQYIDVKIVFVPQSVIGGRVGLWHPGSLTLGINIPIINGIYSKHNVNDTLEHELMHMLQTYLELAHPNMAKPGIPSGSKLIYEINTKDSKDPEEEAIIKKRKLSPEEIILEAINDLIEGTQFKKIIQIDPEDITENIKNKIKSLSKKDQKYIIIKPLTESGSPEYFSMPFEFFPHLRNLIEKFKRGNKKTRYDLDVLINENPFFISLEKKAPKAFRRAIKECGNELVFDETSAEVKRAKSELNHSNFVRNNKSNIIDFANHIGYQQLFNFNDAPGFLQRIIRFLIEKYNIAYSYGDSFGFINENSLLEEDNISKEDEEKLKKKKSYYLELCLVKHHGLTINLLTIYK